MNQTDAPTVKNRIKSMHKKNTRMPLNIYQSYFGHSGWDMCKKKIIQPQNKLKSFWKIGKGIGLPDTNT